MNFNCRGYILEGKNTVKLLQSNVKWINTVIWDICPCFVFSSASAAEMADFTSICQV